MSSDQLTPHDLALVDAVAERVFELLIDRRSLAAAATRLMDASELAEVLGVQREWVYEHADGLGAIRLDFGQDKRRRGPRLRFDFATVLSVFQGGDVRLGNGPRSRLQAEAEQALSARQASEGSARPESPAGTRNRRRQRQPTTGSGAPLLAVGGKRQR
jgi:hypothetical protein